MTCIQQTGHSGIELEVEITSVDHEETMICRATVDFTDLPPASEHEVRGMLRDRIDEVVDAAIKDARSRRAQPISAEDAETAFALGIDWWG